MSCSLKQSTTGLEDFTAPTGKTITVQLNDHSGAGAEIVHIRYASAEVDSTPPLEFTVVKGPEMLVVLMESPQPNTPLELVEICADGSSSIVDRFTFNPKNPARGYIIRGQ